MKLLMDEIKLQKDTFLAGSVVICAMYLLGMILHDILMASDDEVTSVTYMGSLMAVTGMVLVAILVAGTQMTLVYNYAVALGCARKRFFLAYTVSLFLAEAALCLELKLLHFLEGVKLRVMYPGLEQEDLAEAVMQWKWLLAVALAGTAVGIFIGAVVTCFGRTGFVVIYIVFMAVVIGGTRFMNLVHENTDYALVRAVWRVVGVFMQLKAAAFPLLAAAGCLVLLGAAWLMLRRRQVTL